MAVSLTCPEAVCSSRCGECLYHVAPCPCPKAILALLLWVRLNLRPHSNMYVLERVQHRVPEEALRVSASTRPSGPTVPTPLLLPSTPTPPGSLGLAVAPGLAWPAGRPGLAGGEDSRFPRRTQLQVVAEGGGCCTRLREGRPRGIWGAKEDPNRAITGGSWERAGGTWVRGHGGWDVSPPLARLCGSHGASTWGTLPRASPGSPLWGRLALAPSFKRAVGSLPRVTRAV